MTVAEADPLPAAPQQPAPEPVAPAPDPEPLREPFPFSQAAQAVSIWSIVGASLALCWAVSRLHVPPDRLPPFLSSNVLPDDPRWGIFISMLGGGALAGGLVTLLLLIRRRAGVAGLKRS